jgi:4-amino-4-deoxy-L-arabinose transferase-like glycosyltransferase
MRSSETGEPGLLRLYSQQLGGQISWLLPLIGLGLLAAFWQTRVRWPMGRRHQSLLFWAIWLLTMVGFFSVASFFHRYYLVMLAPAIAVLAGAGWVALWKDYRRDGWRGWLLPLALVGVAAVEVVILSDFPDWSRWLTPLVVGACLVAAGGLIVTRLLRRSGRAWQLAATGGLLVLLVPLLVWSLVPVLHGGHSGLPYAGPDLLTNSQSGEVADVTRLVDYLESNGDGETYLAATLNAQTAASLILATGEPVMSLGGFTGSDQILSAEELVKEVAEGAVRFFLLPGQGGRQGELTRLVTQQCEVVPQELWQPEGGAGIGRGPGGAVQLYDCGVWQ